MDILCTSIVPVRFRNSSCAHGLIAKCLEDGILLSNLSYSGALDLKKITDIRLNGTEFYYTPSQNIDIQFVHCESTILLVLTWTNTYDDYYKLVNSSLRKKNTVVKNVLNYHSDDQQLEIVMSRLRDFYNRHDAIVYYAFTFYSILDEQFCAEDEVHVKVLAEPSIIQMDDMQSSDISELTYCASTNLNEKAIKAIEDIDLSTEQCTYVTWASIVTVTKNKEVFVNSHITIAILELHVQRIWNLCYSQNVVLNDFITKVHNEPKEISNLMIDTYKILVESKNSVSATISSKVSSLYKAIVESSQLEKNIADLEQKLNYLIVLTNTINQQKNRNVQESSEIMLFLIAIAQVIPIFFDLPVVTHYVLGLITIILVCVVGIVLIRIKYRR